MKDFKFKPKSSKEYEIVRDYYVSNNHLQGIYFILKDSETKEVFARFLNKDLIKNEEVWIKKGLFKKKYFCTIVEGGDEDKAVHQTGIVSIHDKTYGETKTKEAERIVFYLKTQKNK